MFGLGAPELVVLLLVIGIPYVIISQRKNLSQYRINMPSSVNSTVTGTAHRVCKKGATKNHALFAIDYIILHL